MRNHRLAWLERYTETVMHRVMVVLSVIVLGAAAPARAWCEASCLAPRHDTPAHCPSHGTSGDATSIAGSLTDECPVLESARPTAPARLDAGGIAVTVFAPAVQPSAIHAPATVRPHRGATVFERSTPLRI
jgi:hypothetical protein